MDMKRLSVEQIRSMVAECAPEERDALAQVLLADCRNGVVKLGEKMIRDEQKRLKELQRLENLWVIEDRLHQEGYEVICGCDEVGRGPLAGPVVAAAVLLPRDAVLYGINDSKKLSEKKREELNDMIFEQAIAVGIAEMSPRVIDAINILEASRLAMVQAVRNLGVDTDFVVVDGWENPHFLLPQQAVVKGDSKCISIAAASIVAKVYRDRLMVKLSEQYPQYGFEKNKGYGTKEHYEALLQYGPCEMHRTSFNLKLAGNENE